VEQSGGGQELQDVALVLGELDRPPIEDGVDGGVEVFGG
jgi:hypothetical protein